MSKPDDVSQSSWDRARRCAREISIPFERPVHQSFYEQPSSTASLILDAAAEESVISIARAIDAAVAERREKDAVIAESHKKWGTQWGGNATHHLVSSVTAEEIEDKIRKAPQ